MPPAEPPPYVEAPPPAALADLVACVWVAVTTDASPVGGRILPDGCMDLIWSPGGAPFVAGPDRTAQVVDAPVGTVHLGVRFRPGAGLAAIGTPAVELVGRQVDLEDLWGAAGARVVTDRLEAAVSTDEAIDVLLRSVTRKRRTLDATVGHTVDVVRRRAAGERVRLDSALSERQLRRRFVTAVGYGPKTLERILRFQRFLGLARGDRTGSLARLAAEAGYADQAHLARESRDLAGLAPSHLVR